MTNLYNICCDSGTFGFYTKNSGKLPLPPQAKLPPYAYEDTFREGSYTPAEKEKFLSHQTYERFKMTVNSHI